jgi:uncharacterized coiled-coil protein SlyX
VGDNMLDDEELKQIINEQSIKISELEEKVKLLSFRIDKLETNTAETIDDVLDGGRVIRG